MAVSAQRIGALPTTAFCWQYRKSEGSMFACGTNAAAMAPI